MRKLLTGVAAIAALALCGSIAQACDFHATHVTASAATPAKPVVAMSTYDGQPPAPIVAEDVAQAQTTCAAGEENCVPAEE